MAPAGADQRAFGWTRPPWFDRLGAEHAAFRERAGLIDLSSFGKIEVMGPARSPCSSASATTGSTDRWVVVYTQFLNRRGGIVADVTVTRLGEDRFRVTTGSATVDADLGWIRMHVRPEDGRVELREVSDELAVIGLWGPLAREVLGAVTDGDVSNEAFPFLTSRELHVGRAPVVAQRISWVGELGWELWIEPGWAVTVWDRLFEAGRPFGVEPCGYRALDGLRLERGYRAYGTDLTAADTPDEAGLAFCVDISKAFVGRDAILSARQTEPSPTRLRTLLIVGERYLPIFGAKP